MQTPRINVGKLLRLFMVSLVLPFGAVMIVDQMLGTAPLLTVFGIAVCFPLASFVVMRATLQEMGRVIDQVAPKQAALPDDMIAYGRCTAPKGFPPLGAAGCAIGVDETTGVPRPN